MEFRSYASSSKGNLYTLDDGKTRLMLECGFPYKKIQAMLAYNMDFDGCLITHEHNDHARAAKDLIIAGIDVYMTAGTERELFLAASPQLHIIKARQMFRVGSYSIYPFAAYHDCAEGVSYVIKSDVDGDILLFATDTYCIDAEVTDVSMIALETNYDADTIFVNPTINMSALKRITKTHMSIQDAEKYLTAANKCKLREVYLMHMSASHSHENSFTEKIRNIVGTGVKVVACHE